MWPPLSCRFAKLHNVLFVPATSCLQTGTTWDNVGKSCAFLIIAECTFFRSLGDLTTYELSENLDRLETMAASRR